MILDVFGLYVVGWMTAPRQSAVLAEELIAETCRRKGIERDQLTVHADRGSLMRSKLVAQLLANVGVTKTHLRPHVSNDNPFSEATFKTLKDRPDFPERFGCIEDARAYCVDFFAWYNGEHYHSGLALHTPDDVHHGRARRRLDARADVLVARPRRAPGALRPRRATPGRAADRRLDQQAHHLRPRFARISLTGSRSAH